jgi:hypothetical protein
MLCSEPTFLVLFSFSTFFTMHGMVLLERVVQPCQQRSLSAALVLQRRLGTQSHKQVPRAFSTFAHTKKISSQTRPFLFEARVQTSNVAAFSFSSIAPSTPASGAEAQGASMSAQGAACATTIPRPRLSPLPYIYLKDLSYNCASELQELLVHRQIRMRKERQNQSTLNLDQHGDEDIVSSSTSCTLPMEDGATDVLLLVEHTPTYTNGRRNRGAQAISSTEASRLQNLGATYVESLRGGEITFHGPGQLVAYPILDLKPVKVKPCS